MWISLTFVDRKTIKIDYLHNYYNLTVVEETEHYFHSYYLFDIYWYVPTSERVIELTL